MADWEESASRSLHCLGSGDDDGVVMVDMMGVEEEELDIPFCYRLGAHWFELQEGKMNVSAVSGHARRELREAQQLFCAG